MEREYPEDDSLVEIRPAEGDKFEVLVSCLPSDAGAILSLMDAEKELDDEHKAEAAPSEQAWWCDRM